MHFLRATALPILVLVLSAPPVFAGASPSAPIEGSPKVKISLITILPGLPLYSSFGHTALRVIDEEKRTDRLYNYGQAAHPFDLLFLKELVLGRMEFMVASFDTKDAISFYKRVENRTIIEQPLNLSTKGVSFLRERLESDLRPERSTYAYRFFEDNCTTRVWKILLEAVADRRPEGPPSERRTYRQAVEKTLIDRPNLYLGLSWLLGPYVDVSRRLEKSVFLPQELMDQVGAITVDGPSGREPLAENTWTIYRSTRPEWGGGRPFPIALVLSLALCAVALFLALRPRSLGSRVFDFALFGAVSLGSVVLGVLWWLGEYREAAWNANLLWTLPTPIALAMGAFFRRGPLRRGLGLVPAVAFAAAAAAIAVAVFGGFGAQTVEPEFRVLAAAVSLRWVARLLPQDRKVVRRLRKR